MPHLENWSIISRRNVPYSAPEILISQLIGTVSGHPKIPDGNLVTTSMIKDIDFEANTATTRNTEYTLGAPDSHWIKWCDHHGIDHKHVSKKEGT